MYGGATQGTMYMHAQKIVVRTGGAPNHTSFDVALLCRQCLLCMYESELSECKAARADRTVQGIKWARHADADHDGDECQSMDETVQVNSRRRRGILPWFGGLQSTIQYT